MKRLKDIETDEVSLEVYQCDCGFHVGLDATYTDQVGPASVVCPSCGLRLDTAELRDMNRDSYDRDGYDRDGYDEYGYDRAGRDRDGYGR